MKLLLEVYSHGCEYCSFASIDVLEDGTRRLIDNRSSADDELMQDIETLATELRGQGHEVVIPEGYNREPWDDE